MKKFIYRYIACLFLAAVVVLSGGTALAQPEEPMQAAEMETSAVPVVKASNFVIGHHAEEELYGLWTEARDSIRGNEYEAAKKKLNVLYARCRVLGIASFEALSAAMVKEGRSLADSEDFSGANLIFDTAIQISPNYPISYYAKGWATLSQNKLKFLVAFDTLLEGMSRAMDDFWWSLSYTANKLTSVLFALAALFSLFGLFIALRYTPLLAHDITERFDRTESENTLKYLVLPALFIAVLVILGYWWAVTIILVVLWVYFNKREKTLAIIFFLVLIFMPDVMERYAKYIQAGGNDVLWVYSDVNKGRTSPGTEVMLKRIASDDPGNRTALFALARLYKEQQRYDDSVAVYNRLIELSPENANYRVNLGNVYFITGDNKSAIEQYKAAINYTPDSTLAHFNLGQVYGESLMFGERDEEDRAATKLDPQRVAVLKSLAGETPLSLVFDARISNVELWDIALKDANGSKGLGSSMWSTTVKIMPLQGARFAGIGFIVLVIGINALSRQKTIAHFCKKCGRVSCTKCQRPHYNKELCPQCHQIFVKLDGVEARDRLKKTLEIRVKESKEGILFRVSSLLLPGSGHYLFGRPIRGFIFSGLFIFLVKDLFFGRFFVSHYSYAINIIAPDTVIMTIMLLLVYTVTQLDMYRLTKKQR